MDCARGGARRAVQGGTGRYRAVQGGTGRRGSTREGAKQYRVQGLPPRLEISYCAMSYGCGWGVGVQCAGEVPCEGGPATEAWEVQGAGALRERASERQPPPEDVTSTSRSHEFDVPSPAEIAAEIAPTVLASSALSPPAHAPSVRRQRETVPGSHGLVSYGGSSRSPRTCAQGGESGFQLNSAGLHGLGLLCRLVERSAGDGADCSGDDAGAPPCACPLLLPAVS